MLRTSLSALFILALALPAFSFADDNLEILEAVVTANAQAQPELFNYHAKLETTRIEEMITRLTKGMPEDVAPPKTPTIYKFWQRHGKSIVYAETTELAPYVAKMVKQVSTNLAIELNEMLLPASHAEQRSKLAKQATVKTNEVALGNSTIQQVEINFDKPTDLNEAFYVTGMRLPQKQIVSLAFDIDSVMKTVNELRLMTANGLQLTTEIRYIEVPGGYIPERYNITSPDGKIDDMFEVKFTDIDGYVLPMSMLRTIRRPGLQEDLEVFFKEYQINQPISAEIQSRLKQQ